MMTLRTRKALAAALIGVAAVVAVVLTVLATRGRGGSESSGDAPTTYSISTSTTGSAVTSGDGVTADRMSRVIDILNSMHVHAFNASAPPAKTSDLTGGLYINWKGTWDGNPDTAADNTNIQSSGQSDDTTGAVPRHDPVTDLMYLRNLAVFATKQPSNHNFDGDISKMQSIVQTEFRSATYYRCWIYFEFRDLDRAQPTAGWDTIARSFADGVYGKFYSVQAGTIVDKSHGTYRSDFAAECAAMMLDAGKRYGEAALTSAGKSTITHLLTQARDPHTHLFPSQLSPASGSDGIVQAQIKMGSQVQLLDSLLTAYDITGDSAYLTAVQQGVNALYDPALGLLDTQRGGFFFSVDAGGTKLEAKYKESRQAWMLALLEHLSRSDRSGPWVNRAADMLVVVRDRLWQQALSGYVYRVAPDFTPYRTNNGAGRSEVVEDYVTTEAMGIAAQVLQGVV